MILDDDTALQFAVMLQSGLPPGDAILYFVDTDDRVEVETQLHRWMKSRLVKSAMAKLEKSPWTNLTTEERCRRALDQHYNQLAYLLHSEHYGEASQLDKAKMDTARQAIEAKLAGMAGKTDALSQLLMDIKEGKLRVARPVPVGLADGPAH